LGRRCSMASRFTQSNRPLRITTPLGTDVLLLERLSGEERVSGLFRFQLDLLSERQDIDPASILGQKVGIEIDFGDDTRHINGIVSRIAQGDRGPRLTRYRAEVVPQFWLASLTRNIRIFQQKSVRDI